MEHETAEARLLAAHIKRELLNYLSSDPKSQDVHLNVGKFLAWVSGSLDTDDDKSIARLGEEYREHGLSLYETRVDRTRSTAVLRRALAVADAQLAEIERRGL